MRAAHETGMPPMRPLFVDFPGDPRAWDVADQFMFGPSLLVAPVAEYKATGTGRVPARRAAGGPTRGPAKAPTAATTVLADAPLDRIPLFLRNGAVLPITGVPADGSQ